MNDTDREAARIAALGPDMNPAHPLTMSAQQVTEAFRATIYTSFTYPEELHTEHEQLARASENIKRARYLRSAPSAAEIAEVMTTLTSSEIEP